MLSFMALQAAEVPIIVALAYFPSKNTQRRSVSGWGEPIQGSTLTLHRGENNCFGHICGPEGLESIAQALATKALTCLVVKSPLLWHKWASINEMSARMETWSVLMSFWQPMGG
jgi:hypothetical protein